MRVSEITVEEVVRYLREDINDLSEDEINDIEKYISVAIKFIKSYTGLPDVEIDEHDDFHIVVKILCQDMYDNRSYYVDHNNLNKVVETILGMHSVNLL